MSLKDPISDIPSTSFIDPSWIGCAWDVGIFFGCPKNVPCYVRSSEGTESTTELRLLYDTSKTGFALNSDLIALQTQINGNLGTLSCVFVVSRQMLLMQIITYHSLKIKFFSLIYELRLCAMMVVK